MEITARHEVFYDSRRTFSVPEICQSLLATYQAAELLPPVLSSVLPELRNVRIKIGLLEATQQSPHKQQYIFQLIFETQENLEDFIKKFGKKHGITAIEENSNLLSRLTILLMLFGAGYALVDTHSPPSHHIEGDKNIIIGELSGAFGLSDEDLNKRIEDALKRNDKKRLARSAVEFAGLTKKERNVSVLVDGKEPITKESLFDIPSPEEYAASQPEERREHFEQTLVFFRAIDLDSTKRGWAAIVPDVSDKRLRLEIVPGIDLDYLRQHDKVYADILVEYRQDPFGTERPTIAHLYRVYEMKDGRLVEIEFSADE